MSSESSCATEAKEYAAKYRDLSRGTEDAERSERRMKFLAERYPDGKPGDAKPAEAPPPETKPVPAPSAFQLTAQVVQSGDATPSNGPTPAGRPLAIGLVVGGGTTLALAIGLGAGAIATWAEANVPRHITTVGSASTPPLVRLPYPPP